MQRRKLGKCETRTSLLGFGCMRLPKVDGPAEGRKFGDIDEKEAVSQIRAAIDKGVTYIDTAHGYHGQKSELLVGEALQDGYREQVQLATKLPCWEVNSRDDFEAIFSEQLDKLQTDHVDVYLLHALNEDNWSKMKEFDVFPFLKQIKADGRAKCIGFSFHDELPLFKEIVDSFDWDVCQIQLNYMDTDFQAGVEGMRYAAERGLGIIIMEPLRGGKLAKNVPSEVQTIWNQAPVQRSAAAWALRWLGDFEEVGVVLSGMNRMEEIDENIRVLDNAVPGCITGEERQLIEKAKQFYLDRTAVDCTECEYCLPCPVGVAIPRIFNLYNEASIYGTLAESKGAYSRLQQDSKDATTCIECGQCETKCPQNLKVIQDLKDAHAALT